MTVPTDRLLRTTPPHAVRRWPLPRAVSPTIERFREDIESTGADPRRAEQGLREHTDRLRKHLARIGTPLVERDDDPASALFTFVWIGAAPDGVVLQLNRVSDPLDVEDTLLERIAGSEVHALTLRLPASWQGGYLFAVLPHRVAPSLHTRPDRQQLIALARHAHADPFARELLPSKPIAASGGRPLPAYAAARGPEAPTATLWHAAPPATEPLPSVTSPVTGAALPLHRWSTPDAGPQSPVTLLLDGEVWREQFPLAAEILARDGFPPVHLVFLESGGALQRECDYAGDPKESAALLARAQEAAALPAAPWIVAGQSLGGLFAMLAATRHPDRVSAAIAQSPSLWWPTPATPWSRDPGWFEEQAANPHAGAPVLLESGALDAGVSGRCRAAAALLRARGALLDHREHPGGHDVLQWQSDLVDAVALTLRALSARTGRQTR